MVSLEIIVYKDSNGFRGFRTHGHAGYSSSGEYDMVCDAVSVLLINFVNSVDQLTGDKYSYRDTMNEDDTVSFSLEGKASPETDLLFRSFLLGVKSVISKYGDRYVELFFRDKEENM